MNIYWILASSFLALIYKVIWYFPLILLIWQNFSGVKSFFFCFKYDGFILFSSDAKPKIPLQHRDQYNKRSWGSEGQAGRDVQTGGSIETLHHISHLISTYLQGSWKNLLLANSILPHTQCVIFLEAENEVEEKILKLDKHEVKSHLLRWVTLGQVNLSSLSLNILL